MRATALVVDADPPLSGAARLAGGGKGSVTILVAGGPGAPIYTARKLKLTEDRWLVPGMEIPVAIDPARPERFEVEWAAVPSIEERVRANDPTLADPTATLARIGTALAAAGISAPPPGASPAGIAGGGVLGALASGDSRPDHLAEAIKDAAQKTAPPGKQRAVVVISAITQAADTSGGEAFDHSTVAPL